MLLHFLLVAQLLFAVPCAVAQNWTANPFVPPATPLAVRTPYLQTWAQMGGVNGSLNSGWQSYRDGSVCHRTESFRWFHATNQPSPNIQKLTWTGFLRVDGQFFDWMGDPQTNTPAVQRSATVRAFNLLGILCGRTNVVQLLKVHFYQNDCHDGLRRCGLDCHLS